MFSPGCSKLDLSALIKAIIAFLILFFLMSEVIPVESVWMLFLNGGEKTSPSPTWLFSEPQNYDSPIS